MDAQVELAKVKAILHNLIICIEADVKEIDVLGSLLVINDQLDRLDEVLDQN